MSHASVTNAILTDADVRAILVSREPLAVLGARYGVHPNTIDKHRNRRSKRAIRLAHGLGILPLPDRSAGWLPRDGAEVGVPSRDWGSGR